MDTLEPSISAEALKQMVDRFSSLRSRSDRMVALMSDSYRSPTAISIDRDSDVTQKVAEENFELYTVVGRKTTVPLPYRTVTNAGTVCSPNTDPR
jgi:hypothetical protein